MAVVDPFAEEVKSDPIDGGLIDASETVVEVPLVDESSMLPEEVIAGVPAQE